MEIMLYTKVNVSILYGLGEEKRRPRDSSCGEEWRRKKTKMPKEKARHERINYGKECYTTSCDFNNAVKIFTCEHKSAREV